MIRTLWWVARAFLGHTKAFQAEAGGRVSWQPCQLISVDIGIRSLIGVVQMLIQVELHPIMGQSGVRLFWVKLLRLDLYANPGL